MKNKPADTKALGAILIIAGLVCLAPLFLGLTKAHGLDVRVRYALSGNGSQVTNLDPQHLDAGVLASGVLVNFADIRPGTAGTGAYVLPATSSLDVGSGGQTLAGTLAISGAASYLTVQSSMTAPWARIDAGLIGTSILATGEFFRVSGGSVTVPYLSNLGGTYLAGNVGIGTTDPSPAYSLDISTSGYSSPSLTANNGVVGIRAPNSGGLLEIGHHGSASAWIQSKANNLSAGALPLWINPLGGNVGIGTTSPGAALDVGGGMLKLKQMALAAIVAATPGATEVGGMVMCTDCAKTFSICVATGTTVQGFQLFGATSATECK